MKTPRTPLTLLSTLLFALLLFAQAQTARAQGQTTSQSTSQSTSDSSAQAKPAEKSLYQRLGGYDALAAVSDEFLQRLGADKRLSRFVDGMSVDSQKKLRQHLVDFLCEKTGGPCLYIGRDMKTSHTGLRIDEDDWKAGGEALVATLDKFKVPPKEKEEVIAFVMSLKGDIVGR